MAFLKFNKAELVNLEYSLKREILGSNKRGAYFNTSIISCNTRKYHGLLVVPIKAFSDKNFVLLSKMDETVLLGGQPFHLGINCYGDVYEPKGHKYVIDFDDDSIPELTYKVGPVILRKSIVIAPQKNQVMLRYALDAAPGKISLAIKPYLAFRGIHELTHENPVADTSYVQIDNGAAFRLYEGFPQLNIQASRKSDYAHQPYWYKGITYSAEYRRGFSCVEDLLVPGTFTFDLKPGEEIIISASTGLESSKSLRGEFSAVCKSITNIGSHRDILLGNAEHMKVYRKDLKTIVAGYSWLETGLLRESLLSLPGLTLYANGDTAEFEEILDNLIKLEGERLFRKTTQIEAPLLLADVLQQYIAFGADPQKVWSKYGATLKKIIASYRSREEASICPNGLLWCQKEGVALSWMNTYINFRPVNERCGYQVETNALWYNALCLALEMEGRFGAKNNAFIKEWRPVCDLVKDNFQSVFEFSRRGFRLLADFVDNAGQHRETRCNALMALYTPYQLVDDQVISDVLNTINNELVTRRGIRTLSPRSIDYRGFYDGSQSERDFAAFNGCTHTMLLGFYVDLCFRLIGSNFEGKAKWLTEGFFEDINLHGVGAFSELYDGDPPHEPHGAIASATATSALSRCMYLMEKYNGEAVK